MSALLLVMVLLALALSACSSLPSDGELKAQFQRSRIDLARLQEMVAEDGLKGRVHAGYVDDSRLTPERLSEYRRLMKASGITRLLAKEPGEAEYVVDAQAFTMWAPTKASCTPNLATALLQQAWMSRAEDKPEAARHCSAVQPLNGNWWLLRYEHR